MGVKSGFQKLLKDDVSLVFILRCTCHSFAFCENHAVNALLTYLDSLLKNVSSYFAHSTKRLGDFTLIQDEFNVKHFKIQNYLRVGGFHEKKLPQLFLEQCRKLPKHDCYISFSCFISFAFLFIICACTR